MAELLSVSSLARTAPTGRRRVGTVGRFDVGVAGAPRGGDGGCRHELGGRERGRCAAVRRAAAAVARPGDGPDRRPRRAQLNRCPGMRGMRGRGR